MSDTATEKETEVVVGTIDSVVKKREDTWQIVVRPDGSQYTKNLWTKSTALVAEADAALGQHKTFECNVSYWKRQDGTEVRSLWLEKMTEGSDGAERSPVTQAEVTAAQRSAQNANPVVAIGNAMQGRTGSGNEMTKEEWARKDSAIHKMACIKTAADALRHTLPSDPTPEDLSTFLGRVTTLTLAWHRSVIAERDDPTGEDVPF